MSVHLPSVYWWLLSSLLNGWCYFVGLGLPCFATGIFFSFLAPLRYFTTLNCNKAVLWSNLKLVREDWNLRSRHIKYCLLFFFFQSSYITRNKMLPMPTRLKKKSISIMSYLSIFLISKAYYSFLISHGLWVQLCVNFFKKEKIKRRITVPQMAWPCEHVL